MHIQVNIFPDPFPIDAYSWNLEINALQRRITNHILDSTVKPKSAAFGSTSLLNKEGMIIATVHIRRGS